MKSKLALTLAAFMAAVTIARAQDLSPGIVEPQMLRLQISGVYFGIRAEGEIDQTKFLSSGQTYTYQREFLGPVLGFNALGSVYHPNFLQFSFAGEIWPGYAIQESSNSANTLNSTNQKQVQLLGNYFADFRFLQQKPYRFDLFFRENYSYRDLDYFNRVEVIGSQYGGNFGYQAGPVPFTIRAWQRNEQTYGQTYDTSLQETNLSFDAQNKRKSGETTFNATWSNSNRVDSNTQGTNAGYSVGIGDTEAFGSSKQFQLGSNASYSTHQSGDGPTKELNASENLFIEHSPTLSSLYEVNYSRSNTQGAQVTVDSDNLNGDISLRHQLYKSLTSTLRLEGQEFSNNGSFIDENIGNTASQSKTTSFGAGVTEQYTKRLGSVGRFSLVGSILVDHVTVDNSGNTLIIVDERHAFATGTSGGTDAFFLSLPDVDQSTIVITDDKNSLPAYQEHRDYTVSTNGSLTTISRVPGGNIPQGSAVLVDYRAQQASGSGQYDTVNKLADMRVDLWNSLFAVYGRVNSVTNNAPADLLVQSVQTRVVGADTTWRWLHVGVEYETSDSNFSSYRGMRLFESMSFKFNGGSLLSFNLSQSQAQYINAGTTENDYLFMTRYQRGHLQMDAGLSVRQGNDQDQTLATLRPGYEFNVGQIAVKIGYSFEYGKYQGATETLRQSLFINMQRNF